MGKKKKTIYLRSYPKAVFLYPLFIVTLIIMPIQWSDTEYGFWSNLFGVSPIQMSNYLSLIWLIFLLICFFVISVEVKISKLCAVGFAIITLGVILYTFTPLGGAFVGFITNTLNLDLGLPFFFYLSVFAILAFTLGCMIIGSRIDYVRVERNEIWCMKGIAGKTKDRFPTRSIEINVERPDFLERLLGTGRVTIKIPSLNKFIQLDTVFRAGRKVRDIDYLLSAIKVDDTGAPVTVNE